MRLFLLLIVLLLGNSALACYGEYCSTQLGTLYDYPWKFVNQVTKPYPPNFISLMDGAYDVTKLPPVTQHTYKSNYSYKVCNGNNCRVINGNTNP